MKLNARAAIEAVRNRANIVEVVGDFLPLKKAGVRYTALCPFHDDRHEGNFVVYPKFNCYKCFACGSSGDAIEFVKSYCGVDFLGAVKMLADKYGIEANGTYKRPKLFARHVDPLPLLVLPPKMVSARMSTNNNLCNWLRGLPWEPCQRQRLENAFKEYCIGTSKMGHVIFWQIDEERRVRTGKMMLYKNDGHRDKVSRYNFDWVHSSLFRSPLPEWDESKQECKPCLFGLHLLNVYPRANVNIVESEKTTLVLAAAYGNNQNDIWLASGGLENINCEKLAAAIKRHRRVILHPDRDGIAKWRAKAVALNYDRVLVNTMALTEWWQSEDGEKADLADILVGMMQRQQKPPLVTFGSLKNRNPSLALLEQKLDLVEL